MAFASDNFSMSTKFQCLSATKFLLLKTSKWVRFSMGTCGRTINSENLHIEARKEKLLSAKLLGHHEARIGTPCKPGTGTERHPGDFSVPGPPSTKSNYSNTKIF